MSREKQSQSQTKTATKPVEAQTKPETAQTSVVTPAGPLAGQINLMNDSRMPSAQRQMHAQQVNAVAGNNYLQRLMQTNGASSTISRQTQPTVQRQTQGKTAPPTPQPDYHIAISQSGQAFLVADPTTLTDGSFSKNEKPISNKIGAESSQSKTGTAMNTYARDGKEIEEIGALQWSNSPPQDMYKNFETNTNQDQNIDIYIYKDFGLTPPMVTGWKRIAHVNLTLKVQGNVHEVVKQLNGAQLGTKDLSAILPLLHTIPGVGNKSDYSDAAMLYDAGASNLVSGLPACVKGDIGTKPNDRYEFVQYMDAILGPGNTAAHFSKIREVKGFKGIYLHESAAVQLEAVMKELAAKGQTLPTITCGYGLRGRFRVNSPQSQGMMMHPMGYAVDLYAVHNPYVHKNVKRDGKYVPNETKEFTDIMAQELGDADNAGPANLKLEGKNNQYVMAEKIANGTATAKEKADYLAQVESEMNRLAQASARFQRLITVEARTQLKKLRTAYMGERKRWTTATADLNGKLKKKQQEQKNLEAQKATWEKKKDSEAKTKKLQEIQAGLDKVTQEIAEINQKLAAVVMEQQTYETTIKPQLTQLLQPVADNLASARGKLEQGEQGEDLKNLRITQETIEELLARRARIESGEEILTIPSITLNSLDPEINALQKTYKPAPVKTKAEQLAYIDKEIEVTKQAAATTDTKTQKHKNRVAWDRIRKLEKMLTTDLQFVLVGEADHINPGVAGLLLNGFFTIAETATDQKGAVDPNTGQKQPDKPGLISEGYLDKDWHVQNIAGFNIEFFKTMLLHGFTTGAAWDSPDSMHFDYDPGRRKLPADIAARMKTIKQKVNTSK